MKKKRKIPVKIREEKIGKIILSICHAFLLYDVIVEGEVSQLNKIKEKLDIYSDILIDGIYGTSILVLDTCDTKREAENLFKMYREKLCGK